MIEIENYHILMENWLTILRAKTPSPVLLSVPHDGLPGHDLLGLFEPRKTGYHVRDLQVWPIAKDILLSANANAIRGLIPRAFVDYNRAYPDGINYYPRTQKEVHTALDDVRWLPYYEAYHAAIDQILSDSIQRFGVRNVLLIDLHGFVKQPPYAPQGGYDLILGTGNRASIHHGDVDVALAEFMSGRGYNVFLPRDMSVGPEEDYYSADYTTRHHSARRRVNSIQIEISDRFRTKGSDELGRKLSRDFAEFIKGNCLV